MRKNSEGFTLIELLIAMSVGTLIAMAFFTIINTSIKNNKKNEQDIKLLNIATSEIENIREQIKDTNSDNLIVNTIDQDTNSNISIKLDDSGEIDYVIGGNINEYELEDHTLSYKSTIENTEYKFILELKRDIVNNTHLCLYNIDIKLRLENSSFSKREIHLETNIFGK